MRANIAWIMLLPVGWAISITPLVAQGPDNDAVGYFTGIEVRFMKHAEAVYVFSVKANSKQNRESKDLRLLGSQARQALLDTLCNIDNLNWVTGGVDCEARDIGVLFKNSKEKLILRFCSVCAPYAGCEFEGTFGQKSVGGWIKRRPWEAWKQSFAQSKTRK
jgi:hypothetical protein